MADYQVTRIRKPNRNSSHEHITHIGGVNWVLTREEAMQLINARTHTFHVVDTATGIRSYVGVVPASAFRVAHLRTYADRVWNDNLLALPEIA